MTDIPGTPTPKDADEGRQTPEADAPKTGPTGDAPDANSTLSATERAELERLRAVHAEEKKWESRSKANLAKLRELAESMGIDRSEFNPAEFDPRSELETLRTEVETERYERIRSEVSRVTGVDPKWLKGRTQEEMTASANEYKADLQAAIKEALAEKEQPRITADDAGSRDPVGGPTQLTAADLERMTNAEILKAKDEGRLNHLLGTS